MANPPTMNDNDPFPDDGAPGRSPWGFGLMVVIMVAIVAGTIWVIVR